MIPAITYTPGLIVRCSSYEGMLFRIDTVHTQLRLRIEIILEMIPMATQSFLNGYGMSDRLSAVVEYCSPLFVQRGDIFQLGIGGDVFKLQEIMPIETSNGLQYRASLKNLNTGKTFQYDYDYMAGMVNFDINETTR